MGEMVASAEQALSNALQPEAEISKPPVVGDESEIVSTEQIQPNTVLTHTLADGREVSGTFEDARKLCPYLARLSVENAMQEAARVARMERIAARGRALREDREAQKRTHEVQTETTTTATASVRETVMDAAAEGTSDEAAVQAQERPVVEIDIQVQRVVSETVVGANLPSTETSGPEVVDHTDDLMIEQLRREQEEEIVEVMPRSEDEEITPRPQRPAFDRTGNVPTAVGRGAEAPVDADEASVEPIPQIVNTTSNAAVNVIAETAEPLIGNFEDYESIQAEEVLGADSVEPNAAIGAETLQPAENFERTVDSEAPPTIDEFILGLEALPPIANTAAESGEDSADEPTVTERVVEAMREITSEETRAEVTKKLAEVMVAASNAAVALTLAELSDSTKNVEDAELALREKCVALLDILLDKPYSQAELERFIEQVRAVYEVRHAEYLQRAVEPEGEHSELDEKLWAQRKERDAHRQAARSRRRRAKGIMMKYAGRVGTKHAHGLLSMA